MSRHRTSSSSVPLFGEIRFLVGGIGADIAPDQGSVLGLVKSWLQAMQVSRPADEPVGSVGPEAQATQDIVAETETETAARLH